MLTVQYNRYGNVGWNAVINIDIPRPQSLHIILMIFNCSLISKVRPLKPADIHAVKVCIFALSELGLSSRFAGWSQSQSRLDQIVSIVC